MAKYFDGGAREPCPIDDACMVQLIGDDEVFFSQNRRDRASIRRESGLEHHTGFHVFETRDLLLELDMDTHRSRNRTHRAGACAVLAGRRERRLPQLGMGGQPQVIVGSEIDHPLAIKGANRGLLIFEDTQAEVGALALQLIELIGEIRELRTRGSLSRHISYISAQRHGEIFKTGQSRRDVTSPRSGTTKSLMLRRSSAAPCLC